MKKWILGLLAIVILLVGSIYVFIPSGIVVSGAVKIGSSENGATRFLLDKKNWPKWWNTKDSGSTFVFSQSGDDYILNRDTFRFAELFHLSATIGIYRPDHQLQSQLLLVPLMVDSTGLQWTCSLEDAGNNPIKRFNQYREALSLKKNIDLVLQHMRSFLEKPENVYGISMLKMSTVDTLLISTKAEFVSKPGTPLVYEQIKRLQDYAAKNNATQTGHPIFHITEFDRNRFELMTAIPINKILTGDPKFSFKKMVPGSFITTEVKGGEYAVERAHASLDQFFNDYHRTAMAINFHMLITDRMKVPDSTKWVTRIYQPVY